MASSSDANGQTDVAEDAETLATQPLSQPLPSCGPPCDPDPSQADVPPPDSSSTRSDFPLPQELTDAILSYLSPLELAAISQVSRALYRHADADHLWRAHVQANVPGVAVTTPYPFSSFRELYIAHDPRWFLPRYKIWFSGRNMVGKVLIVRYDPRRGCIEGYQLLAFVNSASSNEIDQSWSLPPDMEADPASIRLVLHLDQPVIKLDARPQYSLEGGGTVIRVANRTSRVRREAPTEEPVEGEGSGGSTASGEPSELGEPVTAEQSPIAPISPASSISSSSPQLPPVSSQAPTRGGVPMMVYMSGSAPKRFHQSFVLARPLSRAVEQDLISRHNQHVWPPRSMPAPHRVLAGDPDAEPISSRIMANLGVIKDAEKIAAGAVAAGVPRMRRGEFSEQAFHVRTWIDGSRPLPGPVAARLNQQAPPRRLHVHVGLDQMETFATLDPVYYTPTADKPYRGLFVSHYGGRHGCELLLVHQPDHIDFDALFYDDDEDYEDRLKTLYDRVGPTPAVLAQAVLEPPNETRVESLRRQWRMQCHRGELQAIKLTGDPNVPRGKCTFFVPDLSEEATVPGLHVCGTPLENVRSVRSLGHLANTGFQDDRYIESVLFLVSPDCLANFWLGTVQYFHRVNIDQFLKP